MKKSKLLLKKSGSTIFLRVVILLMGAIALFLCFLILPAIYSEWAQAFPEAAYMQYPFLIGLAATTIPFFIALHQTLKLLHYIDANKAFSEASVKALANIKYCAIAFSILYAAVLPVFYFLRGEVDAPGVMGIGVIMTFAPLVIAVFAAVLQKLLQSAIDIKKENDLTV
jgi:hypothetical protein